MRSWLSVTSSMMAGSILASIGIAVVTGLWLRKKFGQPDWQPTKPWK